MDLFCQKCGEPWDFHHIYSDDVTDEEREKFLDGHGCEACKWGAEAPEVMPFRSQLASALSEILGDDVDGIASEMNDAEYMFGEEFWE